jgi:perosamine synthetase
MLPYGKQTIDTADIDAVNEALKSPMLTTGPLVDQFEKDFAAATGSDFAVAVNSGTAAIHAALHAIGIGAGDEVIVAAMTFVATANAVLYCEGTPVFADIETDTLLIDVFDVERKITPHTKAIIAVDFAGQPCDYRELKELATRYGLHLIADACHSLGGSYHGRPVGSLADISCFSFHPVKQITTCEGGMITTSNPQWSRRMKRFRSHGIDATAAVRQHNNTHHYDMQILGFNYRLSDLHSALGISQLKKLKSFVSRRQQIALRYQQNLSDLKSVELLVDRDDRSNGRHLIVAKWDECGTGVARDVLYHHLRNHQIGVNVHYRPVYQNSFYTKQFGKNETCPNADRVYQQTISLPVFPTMTQSDVDYVCDCIAEFSQSLNHRHSVAA